MPESARQSKLSLQSVQADDRLSLQLAAEACTILTWSEQLYIQAEMSLQYFMFGCTIVNMLYNRLSVLQSYAFHPCVSAASQQLMFSHSEEEFQ